MIIAVQFSRMEEESLRCAICWDGVEEPVVLSCKHVYCGDCIGSWMDLNLRNLVEPSCPSCRKPTGIREIPSCGTYCFQRTQQIIYDDHVFTHTCGRRYTRCCLLNAFARRTVFELNCIECGSAIRVTDIYSMGLKRHIQISMLPLLALFVEFVTGGRPLVCTVESIYVVLASIICAGVGCRHVSRIDVLIHTIFPLMTYGATRLVSYQMEPSTYIGSVIVFIVNAALIWIR